MATSMTEAAVAAFRDFNETEIAEFCRRMYREECDAAGIVDQTFELREADMKWKFVRAKDWDSYCKNDVEQVARLFFSVFIAAGMTRAEDFDAARAYFKEELNNFAMPWGTCQILAVSPLTVDIVAMKTVYTARDFEAISPTTHVLNMSAHVKYRYIDVYAADDDHEYCK